MPGDNHLRRLEIRGFRPFDNLSLRELARVNLVVGKNSLGKTSLLEAISLFSAEGSTSQIRDILMSRGEIAMDPVSDADSDVMGSETFSFDSLFFGRPDLYKNFPYFEISAGPTQGQEMTTLKVEFCRIIEEIQSSEDGQSLPRRRIFLEDEEDAVGRSYPGLHIRFGDSGRLVSLGGIDRIRRIRGSINEAAFRFQFVPAEGLAPAHVSMLWDKIALREEEEIVYEALRLICGDLERIAFVGGSRDRYGRFALAKIARHDKPVPLKSLGEGVNHIFGIAVSLASARNGFLLIDEIENGVHYSVMNDLWALVLKQSRDLNVQVFATTHSLDCIRGFQAATEGGHEDQARLMRLEGAGGKISGVSFDPDELKLVAEKEIEVR